MTVAIIIAAIAVAAIIELGVLLIHLERGYREDRLAFRLQLSTLMHSYQTLVADQAAERAYLTDMHRSELRELLNRLYHPEQMPVAARAPRSPAQTAADQTRAAWNGVGSISPIRPAAVPANGGGPPTDDLGPDVP